MSPVCHCYVHIPFCHHICPYCAFYKHKPGKLANDAFINALLAQFEREKEVLKAPLDTLYFGGGTPSLLSSAHLEKLLLGLGSYLGDQTEVTLEANPATFDLKKAELMRSLGVNRISLGIQSFQPGILKTLGRDHSGDDAREAFDLLREAGFENISIDLMFSIPGQDEGLWKNDLAIATKSLRPDHISCYNLTYEEDTDFLTRHQSGELDASEDRDATLFYQAIDTLEAAGFQHYEISNYAREGYQSRHNQAYWSGNDYLGIGPGAVSTIHGHRSKNLPDTAQFVQDPHRKVEQERLTGEDRRIEAIAMQLRTSLGVAINLVTDHDEDDSSRSDSIDSLIEQSLIEIRADRIFLTRDGKALADPVAAALI